MIKNSSNLMLLGTPVTVLFASAIVILQILFNADSEQLEYFAITSLIYGLSCVL